MTPTEPAELSLLLSLHDFHPPPQNVRPYFISAGRCGPKQIPEDATTKIWRQLEGRNCDAIFLSHLCGSQRIGFYFGTAQPPQLVVKGERDCEHPLSLLRTLGRIEGSQNCKASLHWHENSFRSRTSAALVKALLKATVLDTPILI